jgi:hypothetical protein
LAEVTKVYLKIRRKEFKKKKGDFSVHPEPVEG